MAEARPPVRRWAVVVPVSVLLGWAFDALHVPAGWILAGIIAAGGSALIDGVELQVSRRLYTFGAGVVAVMAAVPLIGAPAASLVGYLLPALAVTAFTIAVGVLSGWLLARLLPGISTETGMLSMFAGGAAFMPAIAREIGADIRFVSLAQYLRLLVVAVSLPLLTQLIPRTPGTGAESPELSGQNWWMIALVIVIALTGSPVAVALRLPVPAILGPLLLTIVVHAVVAPRLAGELSLDPPEVLRIIAFLSIGWLCGGTMSRDSLSFFARQLPLLLLFIVALIIACALSAVVLSAWLGISYFDAYLATSPGAMDTVLAISSETGISPAVVTIQLIRMVLIIVVASVLPQILRFPGRPRGEPVPE